MPRLVLRFIVWLEPNLVVHADTMYLGSDVDECEIEAVSVVRRHDCRSAVSDMFKPPPYQSWLVCLIEDREISRIFVFWRILEVVDIFTDDFPICDEVALSIDHV